MGIKSIDSIDSIKKYIDQPGIYTVIFSDKNIQSASILNMMEYDHKRIDGLVEKLNKSKKYKIKISNDVVKRYQYYSQIKDICISQIKEKTNTEHIYTVDQDLLAVFEQNIIMYLMRTKYIEQDRLSFPLLKKYHQEFTINRKIIGIYMPQNIIKPFIQIILENNNMFVKIETDGVENIENICEIICEIICEVMLLS